MTASSGTAVKPTSQKRSARTRNTILSAIKRACDDGELETLTVQRIVDAAGCSTGAFYGRFGDKDSALAALYQTQREAFVALATGVCERAGDLDEWSRAMVTLALDHTVAERALLAHGAGLPRPPATIYAQDRVADFGLVNLTARRFQEDFAPALDSREAVSAASFALVLIGGMTRDAAVHSVEWLGHAKTRDWFAQQLAQTVSAYVRGAMGKAAPRR